MAMTFRRPRMLVLLALLCPFACGTSESDDEVAEVTSVDDTADLDGTSTADTTGTETTGTETTGTETTGDSTFEQACSDGCMHFLECAPTEFTELYPEIATCETACEVLYGECTQEASEYFDCFVGLQCDQVLIAVTDGPDETECGPAYTAANDACG